MQFPHLNLLFALDVLLEEGSVVAAARRMNLSAPVMSRTLARIRETMRGAWRRPGRIGYIVRITKKYR